MFVSFIDARIDYGPHNIFPFRQEGSASGVCLDGADRAVDQTVEREIQPDTSYREITHQIFGRRGSLPLRFPRLLSLLVLSVASASSWPTSFRIMSAGKVTLK